MKRNANYTTKVVKKRFKVVAVEENSTILSMFSTCSSEEARLTFFCPRTLLWLLMHHRTLCIHLGRRQRERGVRPTVHQMKVSLEQLYNGFSKKLKVSGESSYHFQYTLVQHVLSPRNKLES